MPIFVDGDIDQIDLISDKITEEVIVRRDAQREASGLVSDNGLIESRERWGLLLKKIALHSEPKSVWERFFRTGRNIYYTSIAWDYSGNAPVVYPSKDTSSSNFWIEMKKRNFYEFIGDGVVLWPPKIVVGALGLVIFLYDNDQKIRDIGEVLEEIDDSIQREIPNLIAMAPSSPAFVAGTAISSVMVGVMDLFGKAMKHNKNDYVDFFQGGYLAGKPQVAGPKEIKSEFASIEIDFVIL